MIVAAELYAVDIEKFRRDDEILNVYRFLPSSDVFVAFIPPSTGVPQDDVMPLTHGSARSLLRNTGKSLLVNAGPWLRRIRFSVQKPIGAFTMCII